MFKVVLDVAKPLLIFWSSCFFILFWLNVYFFLLVQTIDSNPGLIPVTVGSLYIFRYFTFHSFYFFLYFATILNHFCEHPDYQCFELCQIGCLSPCCLVLFLEFFSLLSFRPYFFLSVHLLCCKGRSLRYSPGREIHFPALCCCMWRRGQRGNNSACSVLALLSVTSPISHKHIVPFEVLPWC